MSVIRAVDCRPGDSAGRNKGRSPPHPQLEGVWAEEKGRVAAGEEAPPPLLVEGTPVPALAPIQGLGRAHLGRAHLSQVQPSALAGRCPPGPSWACLLASSAGQPLRRWKQ